MSFSKCASSSCRIASCARTLRAPLLKMQFAVPVALSLSDHLLDDGRGSGPTADEPVGAQVEAGIGQEAIDQEEFYPEEEDFEEDEGAAYVEDSPPGTARPQLTPGLSSHPLLLGCLFSHLLSLPRRLRTPPTIRVRDTMAACNNTLTAHLASAPISCLMSSFQPRVSAALLRSPEPAKAKSPQALSSASPVAPMPVGSLAHESLAPAPAAAAEQDADAEETTRCAETLATDTLIYREEAEEDQTLAYRPEKVGDGEGRQSAEANVEEDDDMGLVEDII